MSGYTWNPDDRSAAIALSGNNLIATALVASGEYAVRATAPRAAGKWYFEVLLGSACSSGASFQIGLMTASASLATGVGKSTGCAAYDLRGYTFLSNGYVGGRPTAATNDVIGVAWDSVAGKIWWAKNNAWMLSGDPAAGTNPVYTNAVLTASLFPAVGFFGPHATAGVSALIGQLNPGGLSYAPPAGFSAYGPPLITLGSHLTISGNGAGHAVAILDATTKALVQTATPATDGSWSAAVTAGNYYVLYFGAGCQPVAHGPYTVS